MAFHGCDTRAPVAFCFCPHNGWGHSLSLGVKNIQSLVAGKIQKEQRFFEKKRSPSFLFALPWDRNPFQHYDKGAGNGRKVPSLQVTLKTFPFLHSQCFKISHMRAVRIRRSNVCL